MNIYKVFTTERDNTVFPETLILNATVIANSEQEALDLVEEIHGDNFSGTKENRQVALVCEFKNEAVIVNVEYDSREY